MVGRAQRRARAVRARRHLERHERAGDRRRSRPARCASTTGRYSHERYHNQYALLMAMGTTAGPAGRRCRTGGRSCCPAPGFAGIQRYAANWMGDNLSRWDHLWLSIPMGDGLRRLRAAVRRRRHRRLPGQLQRRAVPALDAVRHADARSAATTPRSATSTSTRGRGATSSEASSATRSSCATGCCRTSTPRSCARPRPARRCSGRSSSTTSTTPPVRDIDDEYLFGPDLLVAPVIDAGHDRAAGLPARRRLVRLAHRRGARRARGSSVAPTPMDRIPVYARGGRGHPDVARGAGLDRRLSPGRRSSCTSSCPRARRHATARSCRRTTA